jgi:type IV pilus assembly protein PilB
MDNQVALSGFGRQLVTLGIIGQSSALSTMELAQKKHIPFVSQLVENMVIDATDLAMLCTAEFGLPLFDLDSVEHSSLPKELFDEKLILRYHALPLFKRGQRLFIGISDPTNFNVLDDIKFSTGIKTEAILVEEHKLSSLIAQLFGLEEKTVLSTPLRDDLDELDVCIEDNPEEHAAPAEEKEDAPIVRFINKILLTGIQNGVSDIHFEPYEKQYRIRFRQDGILTEVANPPISIAPRIASRIKIISRLDIAERRLPQDGRFKMRISKHKTVDCRVSTCPTLFGEKIVTRILDPHSTTVGIDALGYEPIQKALFLKAIHEPHGMILVTGPTGSGKTVSLYTALHILNTKAINISTAEDPVEINIPGLNQVQMNVKIGLTFASALRSFLRQDPDVMMVGEIRDLDTAEMAVKAAQTGHIVLSTLHTNSATETISRLLNMGIPSYNVATSINLIIAQRLVRRLCRYCKVSAILPRSALEKFGFPMDMLTADPEVFEPKGCPHCNAGYKGRIGVYETLVFSPAISTMVMNNANTLDMQKTAIVEGMEPLSVSGVRKVLAGITSLQEIGRIIK